MSKGLEEYDKGNFIVECRKCMKQRRQNWCCEYMLCPSCKIVTLHKWGWNISEATLESAIDL
jgi:hypothetical protein